MRRLLKSIGLGFDLPDVVVGLLVVLLGLTALLAVLWGVAMSQEKLSPGKLSPGKWLKLTQPTAERLDGAGAWHIAQTILYPYRVWLTVVAAATVLDLLVLTEPLPAWLALMEVLFSFMLAVSATLLGFKLFSALFENYLLGATLQDEDQINTELLTLGQFVSKAAIVLVIVFSFAQAHQYNLVGLFASLGVGGFAIAFGSQKIVEQILWSVVLYIDRPFTVGDHIHLPDRTLG
ncbi:MAG: hypothetical protein WBG38_00055, partial [Nodosilinea sp.]